MPIHIDHHITSLYFAEDWVDSWYDHNDKVIVMTWFNLSNNIHYRKSYLAQLEASKILRPKALIIDTSKAFGLVHPDDHQWLKTYVFAEAKKLELKYIINIFPQNCITKTGVKVIIDSARKHDFQILAMPTLQEAYDFVNSSDRLSLENSKQRIGA